MAPRLSFLRPSLIAATVLQPPMETFRGLSAAAVAISLLGLTYVLPVAVSTGASTAHGHLGFHPDRQNERGFVGDQRTDNQRHIRLCGGRRGGDSAMNVQTGSQEGSEVNLEWASGTTPGKVRAVNEDALLAVPGMFVVADGMGGHANGEIASRLIIESCEAAASDVPLALPRVEEIVREANRRVVGYTSDAGNGLMGSTLVALALIENGGQLGFVVANVGDSRCYAVDEDGQLEQLTTDHSVVQELLRDGQVTEAETKTHPERHVVTRAIGIGSSVVADFVVLPHLQNRRVLLCSDGVSGELADCAIASVMNSYATPAEVVDALLDAVMEGNAADNATAVVVDIEWRHADRKAADALEFATTNPRPRLVDAP